MKRIIFISMMGLFTILSSWSKDFWYTYEGATLNYKVLDEDLKTCEIINPVSSGARIIIPSVAKYDNIDYSVISIGEGAFYSYDPMEEMDIKIPNSVISIGAGAFAACYWLTSIEIPNSVTSIGDRAFEGSRLKTIEIPQSIIEIGKGAFYRCDNLDTVYFNAENCETCGNFATKDTRAFPSTLKKVIIGNDVKSIPKDAFHSCSDLTTIEIPNSVTSIGIGAFQDCSSITSLSIGDSVTSIGTVAFGGCFSLTTVEIPKSVYYIGDGAFYQIENLYFNAENCETCGVDYPAFSQKLKNLVIGRDVRSIPSSAFKGCSGLTTIEILNSVTEIGQDAFNGCSGLTTIEFPNSITEIGQNAFKGCSGLTTIELPNSITEIGQNAFKGCSGLTTIGFSNCSPKIGQDAFNSCTSLSSVLTSDIESWLKIEFANEYSNPTYYAKKLLIDDETIRRLTIPEGTTRISGFAFVNCEPLVTATFPASIKSVGNAPFLGCSGLQRDIFPSVESYLGIEYDCSSALITNGNNSKIYIDDEEYNPEEIDWPKSLTRIPAYAFFGKSNLKRINIPETVTEIGKGAFYWCYQLTEINIPSGVTKIEDDTFNQCRFLTSVRMPDCIESIGEDAFRLCERLEEVEMPISVTSIGDDAFSGCDRLKNVLIGDVEKWSQVKFGNFSSNPITYARTFTIVNEEKPLVHLDLDLGELSVSQYAFCNAKNLETIRVKGSSIGSSAFNGCSNVKHVCINVDELSEKSFAGNYNLESLYCERETPPTASDDTFTKYEDVKLYVPVGSVGKYEAAEACWWRFLDVYESDFTGLDEIFTPENSSIIEIFATDPSNGPLEIYNLSGVMVGSDLRGLSAGIYIVRQGNATKKILVK